jgi:hypothetical protein
MPKRMQDDRLHLNSIQIQTAGKNKTEGAPKRDGNAISWKRAEEHKLNKPN